jgi:peptidoglycan hydrolase-like protein with peptidoglycan-binding domain
MGAKKGVVAFKLIAEPSVKVTPEPDLVPPPSTPAYQTASYPTPAAAPASSPVALPTLRLTSPRTQGASVKTLQQRLGIPDDGVFGSGTFAAVKSFQTSRGLSPDGVVGPKTWASLFGRTA